MTLSGTTQENCLTLLERLLPGAEVYHFGIRGAGLREYAAQLFHEVAEYHPDLVLVFVSIDDDVTRQIPLPDTFDWQGLRLYQMALRLWADETPPAAGPVAETDDSTCRRDYLRRASSRLAVCRAPIDQPTHEAWNRAQGHLARLIDTCRRGDMDVALVLLPADFQVNAALCESMRMRMGYQRCQLDLEIPQRRLREFAARQQVAVLDLLPHFRAADAPLYVRHDRHWNTAGNATAARIIGSWLTARYSVQPTTIVRAE